MRGIGAGPEIGTRKPEGGGRATHCVLVRRCAAGAGAGICTVAGARRRAYRLGMPRPQLIAVLLALAAGLLTAMPANATTGYRLGFDIVGRGSVTSVVAGRGCEASCLTQLPSGTVVQLTAVPEAGWVLDRWTGCTVDTSDGRGTTCRVTMTRDTFVGATFVASGPAVLAPLVTGASLLPASVWPGTRHVRAQFTTDQGGIAQAAVVRCSKSTTRCTRYTVMSRTRRAVDAGVVRMIVPTAALRPGIYKVRIVVTGHNGLSNTPAVMRSLVVRHTRGATSG